MRSSSYISKARFVLASLATEDFGRWGTNRNLKIAKIAKIWPT